MKGVAQLSLVFGVICFLGSIFFMIMTDPQYPVPMAICGTGLFIGGSVLASR